LAAKGFDVSLASLEGLGPSLSPGTLRSPENRFNERSMIGP